MIPIDVEATVYLSGIDTAMEKAVQLVSKLNEAKTLAGEMASLMNNLEFEIQL